MNKFEVVLIFNPELSNNIIDKELEDFKAKLKSYSSNIINEENWGLRDLSYSINKSKKAFYKFLQIETTGKIIKDLRTVEGDKKYKIRTLPTVWGLLKTKEFLKWLSIITAFIISLIAITKFKTNLTALSYAFIFIIGPLFLLNVWVYKAQQTIDYERISKLNKFIIFTGIMSLLFLI